MLFHVPAKVSGSGNKDLNKNFRKDTISRWCKSVLSSAGIDTSNFKGHSTRAASSSHLAVNDISIKDIMLSAGWSNERTFQQFYHKPSEARSKRRSTHVPNQTQYGSTLERF